MSAGVTRERIGAQVAQGLPAIIGMAALGLGVAALGSYLIGRRLRRQTLGMAPAQLRSLYEHHDAVLHSIGEGLLVFGTKVTDPADIVNDEARRLLELPDGEVHRSDLPESLRTFESGTVRGEMHVTPSRVLVVKSGPCRTGGPHHRFGTHHS